MQAGYEAIAAQMGQFEILAVDSEAERAAQAFAYRSELLGEAVNNLLDEVEGTDGYSRAEQQVTALEDAKASLPRNLGPFLDARYGADGSEGLTDAQLLQRFSLREDQLEIGERQGLLALEQALRERLHPPKTEPESVPTASPVAVAETRAPIKEPPTEEKSTEKQTEDADDSTTPWRPASFVNAPTPKVRLHREPSDVAPIRAGRRFSLPGASTVRRTLRVTEGGVNGAGDEFKEEPLLDAEDVVLPEQLPASPEDEVEEASLKVLALEESGERNEGGEDDPTPDELAIIEDLDPVLETDVDELVSAAEPTPKDDQSTRVPSNQPAPVRFAPRAADISPSSLVPAPRVEEGLTERPHGLRNLGGFTVRAVSVSQGATESPRRPSRTSSWLAAGEQDASILSELMPKDDREWVGSALCAQTDPEAFFPEQGGSTKIAKMICDECTVRSDCLEEALTEKYRFGIWGGLSERERRSVFRNNAEDPNEDSDFDDVAEEIG